MKQLAVVAIGLVAVLAILQIWGPNALEYYNQKAILHESSDRVDIILSALRDYGTEPTGYFQEACCMWYCGQVFIGGRAELGRAELEFIKWLKEAGIFDQISSYEINGVELAESGSAAIVTCTVEGRAIRILAEREVPLRLLGSEPR